jgi:hypothetical protein
MEAFKLTGTLEVAQIDQTTGKLKQLSTEVDKTQTSLDKAGKTTTPVANGLGSIKTGVVEMGKALAVAAVAIGTVVIAFDKAMELGEEGAKIIQTKASFEALAGGADKAAEMMRKMGTAARGTVDDDELAAATITLLSGTTGKLKDSFSEAAPQLLEMAKAANKLNPTLGDTASIYQGMAEGIKNGRVVMLNSLGLMVDQASANEEYARALGKSASGLSKEEEKQAMLNQVLERGHVLMDQVGGDTSSATDEFERLKVAQNEVGDNLKTKLVQPLGEVAKAFTWVETWGALNRQTLDEQNQSMVVAAKTYGEYTMKMQENAKAAGYLINKNGDLLNQNGSLIQANYLVDETTMKVTQHLEEYAKVQDRWSGQAEANANWTAAQTAELSRQAKELPNLEKQGKETYDALSEEIKNWAQSMDEAQASARGLVVEQSGLAESLKDAKVADIAKVAIDGLNESLQNGLITEDQYNQAVQDMQLSFGLANKASIALSQNVDTVAQGVAQMGLDGSKAIEELQKQAQTGTVDLAKVFEAAGGDPAKVQAYLPQVEQMKAKNEELAGQVGQISDKALIAQDALDKVSTKYEDNATKEAEAYAAAQEYLDELGKLKDFINKMEGKTITVKVKTVNTAENAPVVVNPDSMAPAPGSASGTDFIVPMGYPGDSYPLRVQSGERVTVTPASERNKPGKMVVYGDLVLQVQGLEGIGVDALMARVMG